MKSSTEPRIITINLFKEVSMQKFVHRGGAVRLAIVSDTHGKVAEQVQRVVAGCDIVVHAGDICGAEVLELLQPRSNRVYAVRGNNDRQGLWSASDYAVLAKIPEQITLELPGGTLVVEHGHRHGMHQPSHDSLRAAHPDARVIVYGHTHKMLLDQSRDPWILNPGAAGHTRTHGGPSCLVMTARAGSWSIEKMRFHETEKVCA